MGQLLWKDSNIVTSPHECQCHLQYITFTARTSRGSIRNSYNSIPYDYRMSQMWVEAGRRHTGYRSCPPPEYYAEWRGREYYIVKQPRDVQEMGRFFGKRRFHWPMTSLFCIITTLIYIEFCWTVNRQNTHVIHNYAATTNDRCRCIWSKIVRKGSSIFGGSGHCPTRRWIHGCQTNALSDSMTRLQTSSTMNGHGLGPLMHCCKLRQKTSCRRRTSCQSAHNIFMCASFPRNQMSCSWWLLPWPNAKKYRSSCRWPNAK